MSAALGNEEWVSLLAGRFFRPEYSMNHVLFYVDRPSLADLARSSEDEAVESLAKAVMARLRPRQPRQLFAPVSEETIRWKGDGGEGPPPCLAALGLSVLAATEMRSEGQRAAHNYYAWFSDLLELAGTELDRHAIAHAYSDAFPILWRQLRWWLDERHRGALGLSTIEEHAHFTKIGYADSQTIFNSSDREKLSQFFRWIKLKPRETISQQELLGYFRIWASRRTDLTPGAEVLLEEEEPGQLADLLSQAASRWEGVVKDDLGRLESILSITLSGPPKIALGLAAPAPPGFPEELVFEHLGRTLNLTCEPDPDGSEEDRWYEGFEISLTEGLLNNGLTLAAKGCSLWLPARSLHILHMSAELGCWASVWQVRPSERAWLLVRRSVLEAVASFLDQYGQPGWSEVTREGILPRGWALLRDVLVDPLDGPAPEGMESLAPRATNRLSLEGGLPLPRGQRVYLTGGDPDLILPPITEAETVVLVDGDPVGVSAGASSVSLADLELEPGTHAVEVNGIPVAYATMRSTGEISPVSEYQVGHALRSMEDELEPRSLDAKRDPDPGANGVLIRGSHLEPQGDAQLQSSRVPIILPTGAQRRVLLGARPGEVEVVDVPAEPPWMKKAKLVCQSFEHYPTIDPLWLKTESRWKGTSVRRLRAGEPSAPIESEAAVDHWCEEVLECDPAVGEEEQAEWARMRATAEALE
jgi:hypothetical protein